MIAGAYANLLLIEHLAEIVRVNVAKCEGERCATQFGVGGAVDGDVVAEAVFEHVEHICAEFDFVLANLGHAQFLEVANSGA